MKMIWQRHIGAKPQRQFDHVSTSASGRATPQVPISWEGQALQQKGRWEGRGGRIQMGQLVEDITRQSGETFL